MKGHLKSEHKVERLSSFSHPSRMRKCISYIRGKTCDTSRPHFREHEIMVLENEGCYFLISFACAVGRWYCCCGERRGGTREYVSENICSQSIKGKELCLVREVSVFSKRATNPNDISLNFLNSLTARREQTLSGLLSTSCWTRQPLCFFLCFYTIGSWIEFRI